MKVTEKGIMGFAADGQGDMWIAVRRTGLLRISLTDPGKPQVGWGLTAQDLPSVKISTMDADTYGNLWIATINGVSYYQPATRLLRNFNYSVGMEKNTISMHFNRGYKKEFYIVTLSLYCRVNFDNITRPRTTPKVYIDRFSVFNK